MKPLSIVQILLSVLVVVLALSQLAGVWANAIYAYLPLAGVLMLIQAFQNWKTHKGVAYISLFAAAFIFVAAVFILLHR